MIRAGALNVRVTTSSRSDRRSTVVVFVATAGSLPFPTAMGLLLVLELFHELIQFLETFLPDAPVASEPAVHLPKRLRTQLVEALLGARLHVDQPRLFQHAQMLRDLRLVQMQAGADVVPRPRAGAQELDDAEAVGLGQSSERLDHARNMLTGVYACQGMDNGSRGGLDGSGSEPGRSRSKMRPSAPPSPGPRRRRKRVPSRRVRTSMLRPSEATRPASARSANFS